MPSTAPRATGSGSPRGSSRLPFSTAATATRATMGAWGPSWGTRCRTPLTMTAASTTPRGACATGGTPRPSRGSRSGPSASRACLTGTRCWGSPSTASSPWERTLPTRGGSSSRTARSPLRPARRPRSGSFLQPLRRRGARWTARRAPSRRCSLTSTPRASFGSWGGSRNSSPLPRRGSAPRVAPWPRRTARGATCGRNP
mmetsp:Transcript_28576/g.72392  ORF Transcript_28576/g.72392 Transcript_28576/m.72392 type:complete len:200 (+) Transcript_28576:1802-2401(+)